MLFDSQRISIAKSETPQARLPQCLVDDHGQPVELHRAHKHKNVKAWLTKSPRFVVHVTPPPSWRSGSASSNARPVKRQAIRRGSVQVREGPRHQG